MTKTLIIGCLLITSYISHARLLIVIFYLCVTHATPLQKWQLSLCIITHRTDSKLARLIDEI